MGAKEREALLTMTKTIYSTFDMNEVLSEAIKNISIFYPDDDIELWMTQEYMIPNLPIKQMTFIPRRDDIKGQAFLEGRLIVDKRKETANKGELAVPLKGKQGIYGVIHLICNEPCHSSDDKVQFISSVAEIIGHAFENAKLYQQSIQLVNELKVINELTKRLNQSLNKESILRFVITELIKLLAAQYVCVLQVSDKKDVMDIIASNNNDNVNKTLPTDSGYMGLVYQNKEPIIIADVELDKKIKDPYVESLECRSLISVPILVHDEIIGILSVFNKNPHHFSYDNYKMLQLFAQHLGLALTNAFLHEKIQQLAVTDYLTGLYNRSYLDEKIQDSQRNEPYGTMLLFDIDDFKKVNDSFGHHVGDLVLVQVANILKTSSRGEDIAARWGGEEMSLYLPNIDTDIALQIAKRILERIRRNTDPEVTVSCGIAAWKQQDTDLSELSLFRKADQALYEAKNQGKNQVRVYK